MKPSRSTLNFLSSMALRPSSTEGDAALFFCLLLRHQLISMVTVVTSPSRSLRPPRPGFKCNGLLSTVTIFTMSKRSISGLRIEDLIEGIGLAAEKGNIVTVRAIGRLNKGDLFLSTDDFGQPWTFEAGGHKALAGLAKGVIGMKVGGKRRIRISPHLGYPRHDDASERTLQDRSATAICPDLRH